jgi:hypothetical protein
LGDGDHAAAGGVGKCRLTVPVPTPARRRGVAVRNPAKTRDAVARITGVVPGAEVSSVELDLQRRLWAESERLTGVSYPLAGQPAANTGAAALGGGG